MWSEAADRISTARHHVAAHTATAEMMCALKMNKFDIW